MRQVWYQLKKLPASDITLNTTILAIQIIAGGGGYFMNIRGPGDIQRGRTAPYR